MGNVEVLFLKVILYVIYAIVFCIGVIGVIRCRKNQPSEKPHKYLILAFVPIILLLSTYFSGFYRMSPIDIHSADDIASVVKSIENEKGNNYFLNEITYADENNSCYLTVCLVDDSYIQPKQNFAEKFLTKEKTTDNGEFIFCPISSDRYNSFEIVLHNGYSGDIYYFSSDGRKYLINYSVSRKIDKILGLVYAPPIIEKFDIADIIKQNNGYSYDAAYIACDDYVKKNCQNIFDLDRCETSEVQFVHEYNTKVLNSIYNNDLFPKIDEKYNDDLLVFCCEVDGCSDYSRITKLFVFVVERDTGTILEVIEEHSN